MHPKPSPASQSHQLTKVAKVLITGSQARSARCFSSHCLCLSHPTPPLLHILTVLLELFVSQAVTGSPQRVEAPWLLCSIIHTSFKCMSLQPLVTPCHLLGRLFEASALPGSPHPPCPLPLSSPWTTSTPSLARGRGHHVPVVFFTFPKVLTSQKHLSGICQ